MAKTELKEQKDQLPTVASMMEEDSGNYHESVRPEDAKIPFLKIAAESNEDIGVREGDVYNNVTGVVYPKGQDIQIIPVYFEPAWIEWAPRGTADGPINIFKAEKDAPKTTRDNNNVDMIDGGNGNYIEYTHQHYVLVLDPNTMSSTSAMIPMKSTQLKKSKALNTMVLSQVVQGSKGPFMPPRFAYVYNFKTVAESNNKGRWHGWSISLGRMLDLEQELERHVYATAKMFRNAIVDGMVEVRHEQEEGSAQKDHDIF